MISTPIETAACSLDGCGNEYTIVIREAGSSGPYLITDLSARRVPHTWRPVAYDSTADDARAELARLIEAAAVEGRRYTFDRRYALAMAFPSLQPQLPGWERGGLSMYQAHYDGAPGDIGVIERLVRVGRTRPLGASIDSLLRRYAEIEAALRPLEAQIAALSHGLMEERSAFLPEEVAAVEAGVGRIAGSGGVMWCAGPSHPLRVAAEAAQRADRDARWDAARARVATEHPHLWGQYLPIADEAMSLAQQIA